ncbi:MAG TPA: YcaO-like family protein [Rhizomicrobium sp.]|nr:YcaO-like family protein [Rhizomicrobium sp.]
MNRLHTSIRGRAPEETLATAKAWAERARIRAVTDITDLDCLGLPVFVSERSPALTDGFTFGKGRARIESEIGAYMEAIECHFAEPGNGAAVTRWGAVSDLGSWREFAPVVGREAEPEAALLLARATDAETGAEGWIPAALVYCAEADTGASLYGATGNGLASGNSVAEASLHALFELIERDIWSIEFVRNRSMRVAEDSLPPQVREVVATAARNGLALIVRAVPNDFGMPFFAAFLFDPEKPERRFFNGGWGCHLDRDIALMRAVTEVAQSRCAYLHGGRAWEDEGAGELRAQMEMVLAPPFIRYEAVEAVPAAGTIAQQWAQTVAALRRVTDRPIWRVVLTPDEGPLHVVRLVVPLLENFSRETMRVGPRLQAELEAG